MAMSTTGNPSILTPAQVESLVVLPLEQESIAAQVGTVVRINTHTLRVPRVTADTAGSWVLEGAEIPVSDATTDELSCTPTKLATLTVLSNELRDDSSPAALGIVGNSIVRDLKKKIDAAFFANTTANGPSGLASLTTSVASSGGSFDDFDVFEAAKSAAESLGATITSWVTSPATALELSTTKAFAAVGSNMPLLQPSPTQPAARQISGVPLLVSPSAPANIVWGIPAEHVLFVQRLPATVVSDGSVFFTKDSTAVRATTRIGFCFTYPLSIVKITKA